MRCQIAETRVRPDFVVMTAPLLDADLRVEPMTKPVQRQEFVAEFAVERLVRAVLPRLPWIDERGVDAGVGQPAQDRRSDELRFIVGAQIARRAVDAPELRVTSVTRPEPMPPATSGASRTTSRD